MNKKGENLKKVELIGRLLTQDTKSQNLKVLSEECLVSILNLSQPETPFIYSIYISNQDQNDKSTWTHLSFEINSSLEFSCFMNHDVDTYQWITKTNIYFLELLIDDFNEKNKQNFLNIIEKCLCSVINKIPVENTPTFYSKNSVRYIKNLGEINDLGGHVLYMLKKIEKIKQENNLVQNMNNLRIDLPDVNSIINLDVYKKIFETKGELYNYDNDKDTLVNLNDKIKVLMKIYKIDSQRYDYILCIETLESKLLSLDKISENMNGQIIENYNLHQFFCWITSKSYTPIKGNCLGFLFDSNSDSASFKKLFEKCKYETKVGKPYESIEEENRIYLENARMGNDMDCFSDDDEEEENEEEEYDNNINNNINNNKRKKNRKEIIELDDEYNESEKINNEKNKFCIDALSNDRTFCITDKNEIVVYKSNYNDDTIEKLSSLPVIQQYKGKNVSLNKGLLYKSESNMLLLDKNNPYILYQYDLPKGKIISEWNTDDTTISDICPLTRNGQLTDEKVIYGVNPKAVFTLDERAHNKNNIGDIKSYQKKTYANKIISNTNGQFVTASEKGDIRFYDKIGIKAKNLFSLYGDPIRHIEISSDDKYLLLTCDKYLLVLNSSDLENKENAFKSTIKIVNRRKPVTLKLDTKDIAKYGLENACFTPARFNLNKNGVNNIITSLGEYIIIWNYNDIRKNKNNYYKIKKADELVIDNYFKSGNGNKIIVGMPSKVRIQNIKKIK